MSYSHTIVQSYTASGESAIAKTIAATGESEQNLYVSIPDLSTDMQIDLDIDISQLKALCILSDQSLQIETNAVDATGGDTLTLVANEPLIWYSTSLHANPLTADVTTAYCTNSSGATANLKVRVLQDATP